MSALWSLIINNRIARYIGGALLAILGVLTFGVVKKREGRAEADADRLKAETKARSKGDKAVTDSKATGKTWQDRLKDHKR